MHRQVLRKMVPQDAGTHSHVINITITNTRINPHHEKKQKIVISFRAFELLWHIDATAMEGSIKYGKSIYYQKLPGLYCAATPHLQHRSFACPLGEPVRMMVVPSLIISSQKKHPMLLPLKMHYH
ncbi:unnamed protein product [Ixodes pacificus]